MFFITETMIRRKHFVCTLSLSDCHGFGFSSLVSTKDHFTDKANLESKHSEYSRTKELYLPTSPLTYKLYYPLPCKLTIFWPQIPCNGPRYVWNEMLPY